MGSEVPMGYLANGQPDQAFLWVMNSYLPYGIVWLLWAVAIMGVTYQKSRSISIAGFVMSMFLAIVGSQLPVEVQLYYSLIIGFLLFIVWWRVIK